MSSRADLLLVSRGLADSRTRARGLIEAGLVFAAGRRVDKPSATLADDVEIELRGQGHPWVSRGGVKLAFGLDQFDLSPAGRICLDLGASTGGFTDVLLSRGASRVYAVDVGHGQLADRVREHPAVVSLEKTDARAIDDATVPERPSAITADLAFISLTLALPAALAHAAEGSWLLALIKPQFEAGLGKVGKGGIVRDHRDREAACRRVVDSVAASPGWSVIGVVDSPITGGDGNQEYLLGAYKL